MLKRMLTRSSADDEAATRKYWKEPMTDGYKSSLLFSLRAMKSLMMINIVAYFGSMVCLFCARART